MGECEVLHNDAFFRTWGIRKGLVSLSFAKCAASGLGLGRVRISCTHLANKILEAGANVPIPLGGGFVEGETPSNSVPTDQFLGYFTFCCQVELGANDDNWYRLMEEKSGK